MGRSRPFVSALLVATFIAGSLDIIAGWMIAIFYGGTPTGVLRFIASAVFGPVAFTGSSAYALAGLVFHYLIAFCWTTFFFIVMKRVAAMSMRSTLLVGIAYGIVIWCVMNLFVLPLTRLPKPQFRLTGILIGMVALMVMVGIPVAIMTRKFYQNKESES